MSKVGGRKFLNKMGEQRGGKVLSRFKMRCTKFVKYNEATYENEFHFSIANIFIWTLSHTIH